MIVHRRERLQTAAKKAWIDQSIPDPAHIHNICRIDLMAQIVDVGFEQLMGIFISRNVRMNVGALHNLAE
jgi:hypothetical protein